MAETDILTQLQISLDQLLAQFYASLHYLDTHHSSSAVPGTNNPFGNPTSTNLAPNNDAPISPPPPTNPTATSPPPDPTTDPDPSLPPHQRPDPPAIFAASQRELAHDLLLKYQQIQLLIRNLPGLESSEAEQGERLGELDRELRECLGERERLEGVRAEMVGRVERVLGAVRR